VVSARPTPSPARIVHRLLRLAFALALRVRLLLLVCGGAWNFPAVSAPAPGPHYQEYQVKAVWMLNVARYTEWPSTAFPANDSPCVVGVFGKDPFGKDLEAAFAGKLLKGRPFELKRVSSENDVRGCHILFVPAAERRKWRNLNDKLGKASVLVVGESSDFLDQGGIVNFVIKADSIQFEVDLRNAQKAGLKIDANLLKIAARVKGKYE
jgi:YfiR/HmsC-like